MPPATTRSTEPARRPARVAEAIKAWVMAEGLTEGDRLPAEAELIARFGHARGTIREAMRILEAEGLVRSRTGPGGGTFLRAIPRERAQAMLANYFYFHELSIADVYAVRALLEPELAASLAGRLSGAQIERLERAMAAYDRPAVTMEEEAAQHVASLRFHQLLAEMGRNPLLGFLVGFIARALSDLTVYRGLYDPPNRALWERGRRYQAALLRALREGDADAARRTMADHMATARALMEDQQAEVARRLFPG